MANHPNRSRREQHPARNPTPAEIAAAREAAGLSQRAAGELIHCSLRGWQDWEYGHRAMHPAFWELFRRKAAEISA
jgi:putative transcriptional regulator